MATANTSKVIGRFEIGVMIVQLMQETGTGQFYYVSGATTPRMYVFPDTNSPGRVVVNTIPNLTIKPPLPLLQLVK